MHWVKSSIQLLLLVELIEFGLFHTWSSLDPSTTTTGMTLTEVLFYSAKTTLSFPIALTQFRLNRQKKQQNMEELDLLLHKHHTGSAPRTCCWCNSVLSCRGFKGTYQSRESLKQTVNYQEKDSNTFTFVHGCMRSFYNPDKSSALKISSTTSTFDNSGRSSENHTNTTRVYTRHQQQTVSKETTRTVCCIDRSPITDIDRRTDHCRSWHDRKMLNESNNW